MAVSTMAQTAREIRGPAPLFAIANEPPPKIVIDAPLTESLESGLVVIQYRTENLRIVPIFGEGALAVSPRVGHLHITMDDAPWHWVDASGEPIVLKGVPPGPHKILIELADPTHRVIDRGVVSFVIPEKNPKGGSR